MIRIKTVSFKELRATIVGSLMSYIGADDIILTPVLRNLLGLIDHDGTPGPTFSYLDHYDTSGLPSYHPVPNLAEAMVMARLVIYHLIESPSSRDVRNLPEPNDWRE
jgi:hypothetical protein